MLRTIESGSRSYEELKAWGDCINRTLVNLDFFAESPEFSGSYHYMIAEDCVAARLFGTAHCTARSQRRLREVDNDFVLLIYLRTGQAMVSHRRYAGAVPEGSFIAFDSSRPHELIMRERFDHLVLRMPKARFVSLHPAISSMLDRPVSGPAAEMQAAAGILDMIVSLGGAMPSTVSTMSETVVKLLGDWLVKDGEGEVGRAVRHDLLAGRIMKCLEDNFTDPDYSPTRLAGAMGISRRYVDSIFAEMKSTFGKAMLEKRLERCHLLLSAPQFRDRSVTDIAFESGFNDLSHFSKRFRERYGISPRAVRKSAA
ncbi:AraC-binding-like domain-containing protein [Mesorhizobium albiziae]|uniref:AraC-binding-like domain-containing protein n=1 Tax=Neomesorhizobium albiziae TaxID=335020 RepID=A0A1I4ETU4_9HYPH|nr:helix-turn-helix domain-containing protein [Mesorhizobium albiziae]GLS32672.1 transcriptional regulator [Mesorhizobium albiziae]SFL09132.1 AraC-binding-like domain-containing protein [Mesorhizobium albiziae]